jgi:hypothetical protein
MKAIETTVGYELVLSDDDECIRAAIRVGLEVFNAERQ